MNFENKIELLKTIQQLALTEGDRIWTRSATMLYASIGLVGILSFSLEKKIYCVALGCSIIGITISVSWIFVLRMSRYLYERWQTDVDAMIIEDEEFSKYIKGRLNPRVKRPNLPYPSVFLAALPIAFLIGWLSVCAFSFTQMRY